MVGQVLFSIAVRSRSHYSIGIIAVLIKRERTFETGHFKYARPARPDEPAEIISAACPSANPTSLAAQKGYIAATDMKTVAPAELQKLLAAQPGLDVLDGTPLLDIKPYVSDCDVFQVERIGWYANARGPLTADGRFTKDSHQKG
jgi:hypothetical protein